MKFFVRGTFPRYLLAFCLSDNISIKEENVLLAHRGSLTSMQLLRN